MFRFVAILASIAGAAAFAPVSSRASGSSLKMNFENELGVLPPVGFWDPLRLSENIDAETFAKYRTAELKHGRVAQLAVLGYVVPEVLKFPGSVGFPGAEINFADIPNGISAFNVLPGFGIFQIVASIGFWEIFGWQQKSSAIGDFGFGGEFLKSSAQEVEKKTKEIQNGRLAMLGAAELIRHDFILQNGGYTGDAVMGEHLITGLPFLYGN